MRLERELGLFGAVMMGLGAMVGTGVFVSIGIGAGVAGPAVLVALLLAAGLALLNGLSSAQLAVAHPVSGGTYEYGYRYVDDWTGFTAGWVFLIAKSASAATAALGFSGYLLQAAGADSRFFVPVAAAGVAALTAVVLAGLRRSSFVNAVIVSITLASLAFFVLAGLPSVDARRFVPFFPQGTGGGIGAGALLEATALMFVAYTGYARIATLGEEVRDPEATIPKAIVVTIVLVMCLYVAVTAVGIGVAGSDGLLRATEGGAAPLARVAERFDAPLARRFGATVLTIGAVTAMLGVLLNLLLGLSRMLLAMARRGDMPRALATLNAAGTTPPWSVVAVAVLVTGLVLTGDVAVTWSFSAFTVLVYYALTHLAAWRLPAESRRYPRGVAAAGFAGCLFVAFWIDAPIWLGGLAAIAVGLAWHAVARRLGGAVAGEPGGVGGGEG